MLTIEGLASRDRLHPIQKAFENCGALQCGFCGPGVLMSAKALLDENLDPSTQEIRDALSGNLCRCTGYTKMIEAVQDAARLLRENSRTQLTHARTRGHGPMNEQAEFWNAKSWTSPSRCPTSSCGCRRSCRASPIRSSR